MALGLLLTAHGATTKVTVNLWSGEVVMGNWSGYVVLSAEQVSSLEPGCRVLVSVKDVDSSAGTPQVYLQKSNWTDFSPAVKSIVKNAGIESFDITDELFAEINGKGLVVKGCHATLTKIAVQKEVELGEGGDFYSAVSRVWEGDTFISWEEPDKGWGVNKLRLLQGCKIRQRATLRYDRRAPVGTSKHRRCIMEIFRRCPNQDCGSTIL